MVIKSSQRFNWSTWYFNLIKIKDFLFLYLNIILHNKRDYIWNKNNKKKKKKSPRIIRKFGNKSGQIPDHYFLYHRAHGIQCENCWYRCANNLCYYTIAAELSPDNENIIILSANRPKHYVEAEILPVIIVWFCFLLNLIKIKLIKDFFYEKNSFRNNLHILLKTLQKRFIAKIEPIYRPNH